MNFLCSADKQKNVYGLKEHKIGQYYIYLDSGWTCKDNYFFKGIKTDWCKIYFDGLIKIETNKYRSFPIYTDENRFTNFMNIGDVAPVDACVSLHKNKVSISYVENFFPKIPNDHLNFKECKDILYDAVIENVGSFAANNNKEIMIPKQNGIDTMLIRSTFDYLGVDYTLYSLESKPQLSNIVDHLSKNFWGFAQVPEYSGKCVVTGFYGDEWVLRSPYHVHIILSARGVSITSKFDELEDSYMKNFFNRVYRRKCSIPSDKSIEQIVTEICNDHQIWHYNDTTILSPLKHESLLTLLAADTETMISQCTDAGLSKAVIEMLNPELLNELDNRKNDDEPSFFWPEKLL